MAKRKKPLKDGSDEPQVEDKTKVENETLPEEVGVAPEVNESDKPKRRGPQRVAPENYANEVSRHIRERRLELGWTQDELASRLQVSREIINRIERGRDLPSLKLGRRIAMTLRLPATRLQKEIHALRRDNLFHLLFHQQQVFIASQPSTPPSCSPRGSELDIGGPAGIHLSPLEVVGYVQGVTTWLRAHDYQWRGEEDMSLPSYKVVVGRDTRASSPSLYHAVLAALTATGCDAIDLGVVASPTFRLSCLHHAARFGVYVGTPCEQASYNWLRFNFKGDLTLEPWELNDLMQITRQRVFWVGPEVMMGRVSKDTQAIENHTSSVIALVNADDIRARDFQVVADVCEGAGETVVRHMLEELGCRYIILHRGNDAGEVNPEQTGEKTTHQSSGSHGPTFPRDPEPRTVNLGALKQSVIAHQADVGFAFDLTGRSVAVVAEDGQPAGDEATIVWIVRHVLKNRASQWTRDITETNTERTSTPQPVVSLPWTATLAATIVAIECGARVVPGGEEDGQLDASITRENSVLGGKGSAVVFPILHPEPDGIAAMALLLDCLACENQSASQLRSIIPSYKQARSLRTVVIPFGTFNVFTKNIKQHYIDEISRTAMRQLTFQEHINGLQISGSWQTSLEDRLQEAKMREGDGEGNIKSDELFKPRTAWKLGEEESGSSSSKYTETSEWMLQFRIYMRFEGDFGDSESQVGILCESLYQHEAESLLADLTMWLLEPYNDSNQ